MRRLITAFICLGIGFAMPAMAEKRTEAALQLSQAAIGGKVPDLTFQDAEGKKIALADLRGKPLLISLIYTGCTSVCPTIIESLGPAITAAEDVLGAGSFNVLTMGFDTRNDTPARMRSFARAHAGGGENWRFVASDQETMDRLSAAVGFSFFPSAGGFDHMAQVTVLDKAGTIYSQVYGSIFEPPAIVEPLKDLILGGERSVFSLAGLGDRVRLFCTVFDPNTGRYYFDYSLIVSVLIGAACLLGILAFLIRETRKSLRSGGV